MKASLPWEKYKEEIVQNSQKKKFRPKQVVYFLCVLGDAFARYAVKSF
jgi:hypothetical protein